MTSASRYGNYISQRGPKRIQGWLRVWGKFCFLTFLLRVPGNFFFFLAVTCTSSRSGGLIYYLLFTYSRFSESVKAEVSLLSA